MDAGLGGATEPETLRPAMTTTDSRSSRPRMLGNAYPAVVTLLLGLLALFPALLSAQTLPNEEPPPRGASVEGKVVGVSDGDTLTLLLTKNARKVSLRIRLHGIDTPETGQPFGTSAKQFASKAVFGQQARVKVTDTDRYGRTVGVVLRTQDGYHLNHALVRNGLAWWYRKYTPNDTALRQLEFEARQARRGIWSESKTAVAPWDWRRGKRPEALPTQERGMAARSGKPGAGTTGRTTAATVLRSANVGSGVFITRTGRKYHRDGCQYLRLSQFGISLKDAEAQGYTPCSRCW
jgi:micrococcal nuclease